jgi:hypothetical protein
MKCQCGSRRPQPPTSLSSASVKEPSGSLATARQGGKPNTSTPSVPEQQSMASVAAGAARPPLSAVASINAPAGSLTTAGQRGKPNPLPSSPAEQPAASAVSAGPASAAVPGFSPTSGGLDLLLLADAQAGCTETQAAAASTSLQIKLFQVGGKNLICDVSLPNHRPVVPASFQRLVFDHVHSIAHPGIRATKRMISAHYVWRGMAADITSFCKDCQRCARGKVTTTVHTQIQPKQLPVKRFSHVHIDIVGPLPTSPGGCTHLLTMVDRSTRWAEAVPLVNTSTSSCAATFFNSWVSRFGVPAVLTSGERVSGEVSQAVKRCAASEAGQPGLAIPPPLGHAGTQGGPKEGLRHLIRRNGAWRGPHPTWGFFGGLYTTWRQLPAAATREDEPVPASAHETGRGQAGLSAGSFSTGWTLCTLGEGRWPLLSHLSTRDRTE